MPHNPPQDRAAAAFTDNRRICEQCKIGFKDYWLTLAMMHQERTPLSGLPSGDYAFAMPAAIACRVPMCRSSSPVCEGMRSVLCIKFGMETGMSIAEDLTPLVLQ